MALSGAGLALVPPATGQAEPLPPHFLALGEQWWIYPYPEEEFSTRGQGKIVLEFDATAPGLEPGQAFVTYVADSAWTPQAFFVNPGRVRLQGDWSSGWSAAPGACEENQGGPFDNPVNLGPFQGWFDFRALGYLRVNPEPTGLCGPGQGPWLVQGFLHTFIAL